MQKSVNQQRHRPLLKLTATACMLSVLAGCSLFSSKKEINPPAPLVEFKQTARVSKLWSVSVGKSQSTFFTPALAGDAVYAASENGRLMRVNAQTGKVDWQVSAAKRLAAGVGTDGFIVVVVADDGAVLAFDASTGEQRWRAQASSEVLSAPAVGQGMVVVRGIDNQITGYDAQSGERRWVSQRLAPMLALRTAPGIVMGPQTAIVALPGGRLSALALSNGGPRWEVAVAEPRGATEIERIADVAGYPVLTSSEVCAAAYQGRVGCFELGSGNPLWSKKYSSDVGVTLSGANLLAVDENARVTSFERSSGNSQWRNEQLLNRRLTSAVHAGKKIVAVGDYEGYVHFLSEDDGAMVARYETDGSAVMPHPVVNGNVGIFQTRSGTLVALTAE